jgi:hypothetical protein
VCVTCYIFRETEVLNVLHYEQMDILPWHQYSIVGHDGVYLSLCEVYLPRRFSKCTLLTPLP